MSEWQEVKLKEICKFKYGSNLPANFRIEGNYPVYGSSSVVSHHIDYYVKGPGIIVGRKGTVGKVQYSPTDFFPIDTTFYIEHNLNKVDLKFLYYRLQISGLDTMNSDAAVPGLNRIAAINQKIDLPPLPTQQKIAKILSNYDDLIENNLKRIKLLEESARLTYEEWFLRFRIDGKKLDIDPETKLPFGWKKVKVNSLVSYYIGGGWGEESISDDFSDKAYVIRGTDINDIPYGNLEGAPLRCHKASNLASRKLQNKDIIFEVSGGSKTEGVAKTLLMTDNLLEQFNNDVMCASFCKLVRPKEQCLGNLLHLSFKYLRNSKATEVFEIKSASSIINYNWEAFIKHQDLIMPSHDVLLNFDKKVDVLVNEIYNLGHQNQLLQEARDILLPRLMTNVIDTDELDIAV